MAAQGMWNKKYYYRILQEEKCTNAEGLDRVQSTQDTEASVVNYLTILHSPTPLFPPHLPTSPGSFNLGKCLHKCPITTQKPYS